jgi:hypothetical protein
MLRLWTSCSAETIREREGPRRTRVCVYLRRGVGSRGVPSVALLSTGRVAPGHALVAVVSPLILRSGEAVLRLTGRGERNGGR